jgi:prolipoprotein diacylglyceryltransferase
VPTLPFHPVIELAFDPIVTLGDWHVRLQTIGLAIVIFAALLLAARIASRTPVHAGRPPEAIDPATGDHNHLRRDDLLYIAVAALPGAVVGGRLGWAIVHVEYVTANPGALLDPAVGGFGLPLAVVGGTLTAALVATLLDTPIPRWLHALILPLLFGIAGGKLAMVLGGDGQGLPWDGPWATAYLGAGPWLSLAPAVPSHPSQAYEALATAGVIAVLAVLRGAWPFRAPNGALFLVGIALWAIVRTAVAFTWRDPAVIGPLAMDQVLTLGIAIVSLVLLGTGVVVGRARAGRAVGKGGARFAGEDEPDWPDPASRPGI